MEEDREEWPYLIKWSCLGIAYNLYELFSLESVLFHKIFQSYLIVSAQRKECFIDCFRKIKHNKIWITE